MTQPTVVISLDLELSWGSFDLGFTPEVVKMARWTHDVGLPTLLKHFTNNGISATWAVVGAMMRSSLPDVSGLPEIRYSHFQKPWFSYIPTNADEETYPEWFGASLLNLLKRARPTQEIGFHSFSHVTFGWPGMTRERAVAEYRYCVEAARELGLSTASFVYPRNCVGFIRELSDAGFVCFRDMDSLVLPFASGRLRSLEMVFADFLGLSPQVVEPSLREGVVSIPGSLLIRCAEGWRKYIPDSSRLRRLRKGLKLVRRRGGVFHVWFHPENLYAERPRLENVVARFLEELSEMTRKGDVRCLTMGQLADEFLAKTGRKAAGRSSSSRVDLEPVPAGASPHDSATPAEITQ